MPRSSFQPTSQTRDTGHISSQVLEGEQGIGEDDVARCVPVGATESLKCRSLSGDSSF